MKTTNETNFTKRVSVLLAAAVIGWTLLNAPGEGALCVVSSAEAEAQVSAREEDSALRERYDAAQALFDAQEYWEAYEAFEALGEYSDSAARAADSKKKWKAASYKEAVSLYKDGRYYEAKEIFEALDTYEKSRSYVKDCTWRIARIEYQQAKELFNAGDYEGAKALFEACGTYSDSKERAQAAADMIAAQEQAAAERRLYEEGLALKEKGDLEGARRAFIQSGDCEGATEQLYEVIGMLAVQSVYEEAEAALNDADYEGAYSLFLALDDYSDSADKAEAAKALWQAAVYERAAGLQSADPARAYVLFLSLGEYRDSAELADALKDGLTARRIYDAAYELAQEDSLEAAKLGYEAASPFADSRQRAQELDETIEKTQEFQRARFLRSIGEEEEANAIFESLGDFHNASEMVQALTPRFTTKQLRDDKTSDVSPVFTAPDGTKHRYQIYKGVRTWVEAKAFCEALGGHLATLTTEEENAFVYQFMRDCGYLTAYFGLSDEERVGNWIWVTGEPFEYSNWHRGEPSRSGRERYGMYFYKHTDGTWNDSHFYEDAEVDPGCSYICEWDE